MITPRITRLVRVPDLQGMHAYVARCMETADARSCAIVVPTRSAAEALRDTIESRCLASDATAVAFPDLVTRAELYDRLQARLLHAPPMLSNVEREVIFRRAALDVAAAGTTAPFRLRAGLIGELLAFYDELRRRDKTIAAFERLMVGSLEPSAETDRGAERLLRLTRFLVAAFTTFAERIANADGVDEHSLRALLLSEGSTGQGAAPPAYKRIIVTVPDQAADPRGLWPADYDLFARLPRLNRLDIIATENVLAAGYHQRVHDALPGLEEERFGTPAALPVLGAPECAAGTEAVAWTVCRDREEELADAARAVKRRNVGHLDRTAIVFQRPLPYLYLARQVFPDAEIPYQAFDAFPLAAEPFAAALDLILSFAGSEATRASLVELLTSPHWTFQVDGRTLERQDVAAADALLKDMKYVGGWDRLTALSNARGALAVPLSTSRRAANGNATLALCAAANASGDLRAFLDGSSASAQVSALLAFIATHERLPDLGHPSYEAHLRARAAVLGVLESIRDAHRAHDDRSVPLPELMTTIRRWIEGHTFGARTGSAGPMLLDAPAAAYADVDDVRIVGLVDSDWPDRARPGIFYPASLLSQLGWPAEADRLPAARARFHDLLRVARVSVSLSTFTLEDDAMVPSSAFLEEVEVAGLPIQRRASAANERIFAHEAISEEPMAIGAVRDEAAEWLAMRMSRSASGAEIYHGVAGAREAVAYSVSSLERFLECPFKYFAAHVLRLPEERSDESGMTPQERGQFLHAVFEAFFTEWQSSGRRAITTLNLAEATVLFEDVAERALKNIPESDRALERTYLLGSAAAPGLAERAFAFEIEQGGEVLERLLEHELQGTFTFATENGPRSVRLRAKADRIDLMEDGTIRIVDYKLGKAPKPGKALQLPVYGLCAQHALQGRHGRAWTLGRAGYVAFREKNAFVPLGGSSLDDAVAAGQQRLLAAIDAIERGEFPPQPEEPFLCRWCGYATVCRKDYVGDD